MTDELKEQLSEVKLQLRLSMNGAVSESMREKGLHYRVNFGVELPRLKQIAKKFEKNRVLAQYLWNENVRECDHISFNLGNQYESLEDLEASIEEEHPDDDEWYYCLEISVPKSLTTGTYTISFVYTYECFIDEELETPVSQTEPITYTVTFAVAK